VDGAQCVKMGSPPGNPGVVAAQDGVVAEQNGVVAGQNGVVGVQNGGTFEEGISYVVCSMSGKRRRRNQEEFRQVKLVPGWSERSIWGFGRAGAGNGGAF
jgi:hypothetical protein